MRTSDDDRTGWGAARAPGGRLARLLRRRPRDAPAAVVATEPPAAAPPPDTAAAPPPVPPAAPPCLYGPNPLPHMADIAIYLRALDLPPLPIHYNAAWIALGGPVAVTAAAAADAPSSADLTCAQALDRLVQDAQQTLDGLSSLIVETRTHASAYGDALAAEVASPATTAEALGRLMELTRAMIARTRDAGERIRVMDDEMRTLEAHLTEARTVATRDPLTQLENRRAIEARLDATLTRADAGDGALAIAYCDIDHFKAVNDRLGHAVGDRVLKLVARLLADGVGDGGHAGRYGGEEFLLVFDGVPPDEAADRVDRIRRDLAGRTLRARDTGTPIGTVTLSAGLACHARGETRDTLVRRADDALYRAKAGGRNRIERG